jgi:hypothetical protein
MGRERTASQVIGRPDAAAFNAEQRAKQPRQRTLSEMATPIGGTGNDPNAPSRVGTAARGLARGVADMIDPAAQFILDRLAFTPGGIDANLSERVGEDVGYAPTDSLGRGIESFTRGVAVAAPFAPMAAASAPAMGLSRGAAATGELIAGGLAGLGQDELDEAGYPNLAMGAGILLGGMANPAASVVGTTARRGATAAIDTVRKMTPEALAMARANELSRGAMVRGSSEIKRRLGDYAVEPNVTTTLDELRQRITQSRNANMPWSASSRQILEGIDNGRGGRFFTDAERNLTTTDVDYAARASRQYADNADELGRRWEELSSVEPDFGTFIQRYDEGVKVRDIAEREAWQVAMGGDLPRFNTADMVNRAKEIQGGAYFKRGNVPTAISQLASGEMTTMDLSRFQELRSVLLGVVRDARRTGLSGDQHAASMAGDMLEMMGRKIDEFASNDPTGKSDAWARARQMTVENKEFYDSDSAVIRALDKGGQAKNLFAVMRKATGRKGNRTNPVEEAQRLVRIADQSPGGMENLRALAAEDLFAEGFSPTATRTPDKILRQNEEMYRVIFGDQYDQALELIDLSRLHTRGSPGVAAEAYRTGSGVSPAAFLFGLARNATNPVAAAVENSMKLAGKQNARELEWQKIVRTAIEQPEFLRVLLEMPTEATKAAWQVQWQQLVARSSARETARAVARRGSERDRGVTK